MKLRITVLLSAILTFAGFGQQNPPVAGSSSEGKANTNTPAGTNETAADSEPSEADKAWKEVKKALQPPMRPAEWATQRPTQEQVEAFRTEQVRLAAEAIVKARDFYTRFPNHPKAAEARKQERQIQLAVLMDSARKAFTTEKPGGMAEMLADQEKVSREILKEFPERDEGYQYLLMVASHSEGEKSASLAKEVIAGKAPPELKSKAEGLLKKMGALGKPMAISFTAADGREVDLAKLRGKVVLIDFWATWCGPCVGELPNVKMAYEKLNPKGFEIVGISLDREKEKLLSFVKEKEMPWPQYFDGKQWGNKIAQEYGIESIPAMWLVDKQGKLRDMDARGALADKVEKLLAE